MISVLRVSVLELHSNGTEPVTFFGAQSSLGGGAQFSIDGARPRNAPRGAEPTELSPQIYIVEKQWKSNAATERHCSQPAYLSQAT